MLNIKNKIIKFKMLMVPILQKIVIIVSNIKKTIVPIKEQVSGKLIEIYRKLAFSQLKKIEKIFSNIKKKIVPIREIITEKLTWFYQKLGFSKLNKREKAIVGGGILLLLIIFIYAVIISPFNKSLKRLEELIETKKMEYLEIINLKEQYLQAQEKVKNIKPLSPNFSLLSHLESLARQSNVKIDSVKPGSTDESGPYKETITDIKIEKITLDQLVEFLYKIEISGEYPLKVKKLHIKPTYKDPQYLEVSFQIINLQLS